MITLPHPGERDFVIEVYETVLAHPTTVHSNMHAEIVKARQPSSVHATAPAAHLHVTLFPRVQQKLGSRWLAEFPCALLETQKCSPQTLESVSSGHICPVGVCLLLCWLRRQVFLRRGSALLEPFITRGTRAQAHE